MLTQDWRSLPADANCFIRIYSSVRTLRHEHSGALHWLLMQSCIEPGDCILIGTLLLGHPSCITAPLRSVCAQCCVRSTPHLLHCIECYSSRRAIDACIITYIVMTSTIHVDPCRLHVLALLYVQCATRCRGVLWFTIQGLSRTDLCCNAPQIMVSISTWQN